MVIFNVQATKHFPDIAEASLPSGRILDTYGPSRSTIYKMIKGGEIKTVKVGGLRLIPASEGERLLEGAK
jgi:excisionase family DNA binding protein